MQRQSQEDEPYEQQRQPYHHKGNGRETRKGQSCVRDACACTRASQTHGGNPWNSRTRVRHWDSPVLLNTFAITEV